MQKLNMDPTRLVFYENLCLIEKKKIIINQYNPQRTSTNSLYSKENENSMKNSMKHKQFPLPKQFEIQLFWKLIILLFADIPNFKIFDLQKFFFR